MVLGSVFSPVLIKADLESEEKEEVFEELVELYVSQNPSSSRTDLLSSIRMREEKLSTGVKPGVALPHARTEQVDSVVGLIGISKQGIEYDALDGKPVHIIFMLLSSPNSCALHLRVLKRLALLLEDPEFYNNLMTQKDADGIYNVICKFEDILATSM